MSLASLRWFHPAVVTLALPVLLLVCATTADAASSIAISGGSAQIIISRVKPVLDPTVDTIYCSPKRCGPLTGKVNLTAACLRPRTVLVYDGFACFFGANDRAGFAPRDLGNRSGGEAVQCRNILRMFTKLGYSWVVTRNISTLEECVLAGRAGGREHILMVHDHWNDLASNVTLLGARRVREPFREECLLSMTFWGTRDPKNLWPGDLRYYVSMWPNPYNTFSLMEKPTSCPSIAEATYKRADLPRYGVLFGKYKSMPEKVNRTDPFSRNATLWRLLWDKVHLVALDCSDELATTLQWGDDYRSRVTCWRDSPLRETVSYHSLMLGASFFLGLGDTKHSPTPIDCIYCRTPIIMPPYQHTLLPDFTVAGKEYYPVSSADQLLGAVDDVLSGCDVRIQRGGGDGRVTKVNSCFTDPPSLDRVFDEKMLLTGFRATLQSRQILCMKSVSDAVRK